MTVSSFKRIPLRRFSLWSKSIELPPVPAGERPWDPQVLKPLTDQSSSEGGILSTVYGYSCDGVESLFTALHDSYNLPWWVSVIAGTACLRLALLPTKVASAVNSKRMAAATSEYSIRIAPLIHRQYAHDEQLAKQKVSTRANHRHKRSWPRFSQRSG